MDLAISQPIDKLTEGKFAIWLDRGIIFWIFLFAICAPHSIAATQICWSFGLLFWVVRFFLKPRPKLERTPIDYLLLGFFLLTTLSSLLSYDPITSIGKLRAASLFTIVYLVSQNIRSPRLVRALAVTLIASCMISVVYTVAERAIGRGVKLTGVNAQSPLSIAGLRENDTILSVDNHKIRTPEQLVTAIVTPAPGTNEQTAYVKVYRFEAFPILSVPRGAIPAGTDALERLAAAGWSHGRDWRATGLYSMYVTYAEALQLIASLAFGLFISLRQKRSLAGGLLLVCVAGFCFAILLTVTRASALSFLVSSAVVVLVGADRRTILVLAACAIPLVFGGLFVLQQKRNVKFFDPNDGSITWRQTVQREGFHLLISNPRHLAIGVGMDSLKRYWREWGLFENNLPMGHMHSDFLQLALERGVPTLVVWILLLLAYGQTLWRLIRHPGLEGTMERGIVLGALGGLVGFVSSGFVHYNWGDSTVVEIFYLIMALTLVIERNVRTGRLDGLKHWVYADLRR